MNGMSNGEAENSDKKDNEENEISQPSTSSAAGLIDMPKWNISTRQLYEDNLKSTGMAPLKSAFYQHLPRERVPSVTESTSSDDSCVYMYKGDDGNRNGNDLNKIANCSSPEMDYLEMDFDPCQSNGHESSDGSYNCENVEQENDENVNEVVETSYEGCTTPLNFDEKFSSTSSWVEESNCDIAESIPSTSNNQEPVKYEDSQDKPHNVVEESNSFCSDMHECVETLDVDSELSQKTILMRHMSESPGRNCCMSSILQALCSLCGVDTQVTEDEIMRKNFADYENDSDLSVVDYLYSVSRRGLTVSEMMNTIDKSFNGCITSRFFSMQPKRKINLSSWLLYWLKKDVVPVLSFNFHLTEDDCANFINTSWHFQIVRAVGQKGIHLFSQCECVSEEIILQLLGNPSEVLISRDEVITRWTPESDLTQLMTPPDHSWKKYNVLGQVVNAIREGVTGKSEDEMKHVKIPSTHGTGIFLFIRTDNPNQKELVEASDFPLFEDISWKGPVV